MPDNDPSDPIEAKPPAKRKRTPRASVVTASPVATNGTVKKKTSEGGSATKPKPKPKPAAEKEPEAVPPTAKALDRAEDTLDELGKKVGGVLAGAMTKLRRAAAVTREEFEDLWAEAQSIRRGDTK
jgi:hypothetical protein